MPTRLTGLCNSKSPQVREQELDKNKETASMRGFLATGHSGRLGDTVTQGWLLDIRPTR